MKKILTALITPFDENGNVDDTALICLVKDQIKKGVDGFVKMCIRDRPCCTNGIFDW